MNMAASKRPCKELPQTTGVLLVVRGGSEKLPWEPEERETRRPGWALNTDGVQAPGSESGVREASTLQGAHGRNPSVGEEQ
jgi:hypothetical protein